MLRLLDQNNYYSKENKKSVVWTSKHRSFVRKKVLEAAA